MPRNRPRRLRHRRPKLTVEQILLWADYEFAEKGCWPHCKDGEVLYDPNEKWVNLDAALRGGYRGLPGGTSLPLLLQKARGVFHLKNQPPLSEAQIVQWAQAHYERTGQWPNTGTEGPIHDAPGEFWESVGSALFNGSRGLPGGETLSRLLARSLGIRNLSNLPRLTIKQILSWADAYHKRHGEWPRLVSGVVEDAPEETWQGLDNALRDGSRTLKWGNSLARLLKKYRGVRNKQDVPALTPEQILVWADAHHRRTGEWPGQASGPIPRSGGETWACVHRALVAGQRGLPGGSSLAELLIAERGARMGGHLPPLREETILQWAKAYHVRHGSWPGRYSGDIPEAEGENWATVNNALWRGHRGLVGGLTLKRLLIIYGCV